MPTEKFLHMDERMKLDVNRISGYMKLLDDYNLHSFVIWQGRVIRDTPEFNSMMRVYRATWSSIARCISILEDIMTVNAVPLAVVNGGELSDLAALDLERVGGTDLCLCISNLEQIRPLLRHSKLAPAASSAVRLAATTIQSVARRFLERSCFLSRNKELHAIVRMQRVFRGISCRSKMRAHLVQCRHDIESQWVALQEKLRINWKHWKDKERVIVYIAPGRGARLIPFQQSQLGLDWLGDPKIHLVCISYSGQDEVVEYHQKVTEAAMSSAPLMGKRIHVMVPENINFFPNTIPLTALLLYSPTCIKRVIHEVGGRPAVLLFNDASWQAKRLAVTLGVPLLSAEPSLCSLLHTHSGMRSVFAAADVSAPIGAHDIYDEEDLIVSLTKLIASHVQVQRWYIKIDTCRELMGTAAIDPKALGCMEELRGKKRELELKSGTAKLWYHPDVQLLARSQLLKSIRADLHRIVAIFDRRLFPSWKLFLEAMAVMGGVIEAVPPDVRGYPSAHLFLSPSGDIKCISQTEMMLDSSQEDLGCIYPQRCVSRAVIRGASSAASKELISRGVMGFVSLHFVAFWDDQAHTMRLWATNIELGMSSSAYSYCLFRSITGDPSRTQILGSNENIIQPRELVNGARE